MKAPELSLHQTVRAVTWLVIAWVVIFWRLGFTSLLDPDEAHYAQLTREMVRAGNWLIPLLDARPLIDKPVLFHWLQGASTWALGENEFATRLPTAVSALGLLALTRWTGRSLFSATAGTWSAFMLATMPLTFALSSVALFDMLFTLCLFGAVACLIVAAEREHRRTEMAGYGLLTLAVMTKGPIAWVLLVLFLGAAHAAGPEVRARLTWLGWKTGAGVALLAASPWFLWMFVQFGDQFVDRYLLAGNLWYVTQPLQFSGRAISYTFYTRGLAGGLFPWLPLLAGGALVSLFGRRPGPAPAERMLWIWMAVVVMFFSAARFKLDHYIYPAAPACALLPAAMWHRMSAGERGRAALRVILLLLAAVLLVGGVWLTSHLSDLDLALPPMAVLLPACLVVGGLVLCLQVWDQRPALTPIPLIAIMTAIYAIAVGVGFSVLERTRPTAAIARRVVALTPAGAPVAAYRLGNWRASLRYYIDRPLGQVDDPEGARAFFRGPVPGYLLILRRDFEALRREGVPLRSLAQQRCVVGTSGRGLRKQRWGYLLIATLDSELVDSSLRQPRLGGPAQGSLLRH